MGSAQFLPTVLETPKHCGDFCTYDLSISLICNKIGTTQNLTFLIYWYRMKRLQMRF